MTLRTLMESDVAEVFLQGDDFAEACTYCPAGGGANRTVYAVVEERGAYQSDETGLANTEILAVMVSRDPDTTNADGTALGGIDDPQLGDGLRRASDQADKFYAYSGEKEDVDDYAWTLIFTRDVIVRHGGSYQAKR